jgi:hypothetical protein
MRRVVIGWQWNENETVLDFHSSSSGPLDLP